MQLSLNKNSDFKKPVIVLGAGGHAKVLINALYLSGRKIIGVVDPAKPEGTECFGSKVLGNDDNVFKYSPDEIELINGIGPLPGKDLRWKLSDRMEDKGYVFSQVIHPSAIVASDVVLSSGVQIMAGVVIQSGTRIGRSCIINTGAVIDHDCQIGDNCHIAPGVTLSGSVIVGKGTHLGTGTSVIQDITIGADCIVAAGSVVYRNIENRIKFIQQQKTLKSII